LDELDRLIEKWIDNHERQAEAAPKTGEHSAHLRNIFSCLLRYKSLYKLPAVTRKTPPALADGLTFSPGSPSPNRCPIESKYADRYGGDGRDNWYCSIAVMPMRFTYPKSEIRIRGKFGRARKRIPFPFALHSSMKSRKGGYLLR
jgi:hypothetical protein